jgi:hypothetical protein
MYNDRADVDRLLSALADAVGGGGASGRRRPPPLS